MGKWLAEKIQAHHMTVLFVNTINCRLKNCLKCECFPLKEVLLLKKLENVKHIINYKKICNRNSYKLSLWPGDLDNELVLKIKLK